MLLPWFARFAAVGLTYLADQLRSLGLSRQIVSTLIILIVIAVIGLNLYQAYPLSKRRMAGRYQQLQVLFLRLSEDILTAEHQQPKRFIFINDPSSLHIDSLRELLDIYSVPFGPSQIVEVVPEGPDLPVPAIPDIADPNSLIIINPRMPDSWETSYHQKLQELGKVPCEIRNTNGELRFLLWYAKGATQICRLAQEA